MSTSEYDGLAQDYDWLFSDEMLAGGVAVNQPGTARLLASLTPGALVLDAACGTGVDAVVLARRGFRVWAADGSAIMVEQARRRFEEAGLEIPVMQADWAYLSSATETRFDAVLSIGNSLVHAAGGPEMVKALRGLRTLLRPGGRLAVDARNWEKLHRDRPRIQVADASVQRDGKRCVTLYVWDIPDDFAAEHVAHLVFVFDDGRTVTSRHHRIGFWPFTIDQLFERLGAAGLRMIDIDFDNGADRYSIIVAAD